MSNEPILIVDDNLMNLKLEKRLLELEQYQVLTARNAEETLQILGYFHPRLILMDFGLPEVNGVQLTQKVKADPKNEDIVILMATSYDQQGDEAKARAAGCSGYIHKPIDTQALPGIIADYLREGSYGTGQSPKGNVE
jgi:CheY-like chemotaxis protein